MTPTRHCSYLFNPRKDAVICHSARHRSTFRLSSTATQTVFKKDGTLYQRAFKNCRLAFAAFTYWSTQGQDAVDCFIEAIEIGASLDTAERLACAAVNPGWTIKSTKTDKFSFCQAVNHDGDFYTSTGAAGWQELNERLKS